VQLNEDVIEAWARAVGPDEDGGVYLAEVRRRLADDPQWAARRRVRTDPAGEIVAFAWLTPGGRDALVLWGPRIRGAAVGEADATLIREAVDQARAEGVRALEARLTLALENDVLTEVLVGCGGTRCGGRIEYCTPIADLVPEDPDGPLTWRPGALDRATADLFAATAGSGPNALEPGLDPFEVLRGYLEAPELSRDPAACLHVGALDGEDVALVVAQVEATSGWSTCTWLGLIPSARGRGLGNGVHRHGIAMLRAQGGQLYHGGTALENAPMVACFARQRCVEARRFAVWRWTFRPG
jgi:hypothetical protein